jgi:hypothetical protein
MDPTEKSYHIGDISIDADGIFHIHLMGVKKHETQLKPLRGSAANIEDLRAMLKCVQKGKGQLLQKIRDLEQQQIAEDMI